MKMSKKNIRLIEHSLFFDVKYNAVYSARMTGKPLKLSNYDYVGYGIAAGKIFQLFDSYSINRGNIAQFSAFITENFSEAFVRWYETEHTAIINSLV